MRNITYFFSLPFCRFLTHRTCPVALSTSSQGTAITSLNTCPNIRTFKPCGTLAQRREANLWSGHQRSTWNVPLWTTVKPETGLTTLRGRVRSFCSTLPSARTYGFRWETSLPISRFVRWLSTWIRTSAHCCSYNWLSKGVIENCWWYVW